MTSELNQRWRKAGIRMESGPGDFPVAVLETVSATAKVALHGAHILSYQPRDGRPVLWLSEKAVYEDGKAIRGGIPICWPWFANDATVPGMPAHGFARTSRWEITAVESEDDSRTIRLRLVDSPATGELWPHPFELEYEINLSDSLEIKFVVQNTGNASFSFTGALHSYFAVSNIREVTVNGLDGTEYLDSIDGSSRKMQDGPVHFDAEVDRIYIETEAPCEVVDAAWGRKIRITKSGSRSTVVWNPWIDKSMRMSDFGDDEFNEMLCVETSNAGPDKVNVSPGNSHIVTLDISTCAI